LAGAGAVAAGGPAAVAAACLQLAAAVAAGCPQLAAAAAGFLGAAAVVPGDPNQVIQNLVTQTR
jgi:hypothetical protein